MGGLKNSWPALRHKWVLTAIVLGVITCTELFHAIREGDFSLHFFLWLFFSIFAILVIELTFRQIKRLQDRLEQQLLASRLNSRNQEVMIELAARLSSIQDQSRLCQTVISELEQKLGYQHVQITLQDPSNERRQVFGKASSSTSPAARVSAPLRINNQAMGDLVVERQDDQAFSSEEVRVIYSVANQAAIAIQNARLFENQRRQQSEAEQRHIHLTFRERYLTLLNRITREALGARTFDSMLQTLAEQTCTLFDADDCLIAIWDEAQDLPIVRTLAYKDSTLPDQPVLLASERLLSSSLVKSPHLL